MKRFERASCPPERMTMNRRTLLTAGLLLPLAAGGVVGAAAAQRPVRLLMVLVGGGPHDIEKNPPHLEAVLKANGVEVTKLAPPPGMQSNGAHLAKLAELKPGEYDVVAFYTVGQSLSPEQEKALQAFVEQGGGIVAIHGASASFGRSDVWFNMVGARFAGHAPGTYTLPIAVTDPDHAITKGIREFEIVDEEYTHRFPEGVKRHVVASFKQRPPNTSEKNNNNDAVWTIEIGRGRVVYNALGHGPEAWQNPNWQKLTVQSVLWAAKQPREVRIGE
jgi:type 1 glutamine amidotransferase